MTVKYSKQSVALCEYFRNMDDELLRKGFFHGVCLFVVLFIVGFFANKLFLETDGLVELFLLTLYIGFFLRVGYLYRRSTSNSIFESILSGDKSIYSYPIGVAIVIVTTLMIRGIGVELIDAGGFYGIPILIFVFLFGVFSQTLAIGTMIWIGGWFYKW